MPFERESFVFVCTSPTFVCASKGSEISDFKISKMRQEGKSVIFKDIEMGPAKRGTNDSLSNAVGSISIF